MSAHKINFYKISIFLISSLFFLVSSANAYRPSEQMLTIGDYDHYYGTHPPYFYGDIDASGYSDSIYWGNDSNHHQYGYHEVLSGEWGSFAIYYDGIATEPNAMFLTDKFIYPNWEPQNDFYSFGASAWHNPNNPVPNNNTAQSVIKNGQVQVTVDYEVVDLGDGNCSPIAITDANGRIGFAKSFRYLFLQTYTITANQQNENNITSLEFYGMLHSHGADEYGPCVYASYTNAIYPDVLANYVPYNPVHAVGNFAYDFSQWNNLNDPHASVGHTDWVGFSCTLEPDVYDCNVYEGHGSGKPNSPGIHWNIEDRTLYNVNYSYGETAGAMGWYLSDLSPGESTSITVAFMFGYGPIDYNEPIIPPNCEVTLTKTDDIGDGNCVDPSYGIMESDVNYTIRWSTSCDIDDVNIVDKLDQYCEFISCTGGGVWSEPNRTVTWKLNDRDANDSGCFNLKVRVAENAPQGNYLINKVKIYTGGDVIKTATERTKVCCQGDIVYVDANATEGANNGSSWENAYLELRDAIQDIKDGLHGDCIKQIWVANGTYCPTTPDDPSPSGKTFTLIDGINIYGHFEGWEDNIDQRNLAT